MIYYHDLLCLFVCMCVYLASVCHVCIYVPNEARRRHWISSSWNRRCSANLTPVLCKSIACFQPWNHLSSHWYYSSKYIFFQLRVTQMLIKKSSWFAILILISRVPFYKMHAAPKHCFIERIILLFFFRHKVSFIDANYTLKSWCGSI